MGVLKVKSAGVWVPVGMSMQAGAPVGLVAYASGPSADQNGISTSAVDITGLTVTFNASPGRTYRTTVLVEGWQGTALGSPVVQITDAANAILQQHSQTAGSTYNAILPVVLVETGLSGSVTRKVRTYTSAGNWNVYGSTTRKSWLIVEDITPATIGNLNTPRGALGVRQCPSTDQIISQNVATQVGNSSMTGLSFVNGRQYQYLWNGVVIKDATAGVVRLQITNAAGAVVYAQRDINMAASSYFPFTVMYTHTGAGTVDARQCTIICVTGTCTLGGANGVYGGHFTIQDIGGT